MCSVEMRYGPLKNRFENPWSMGFVYLITQRQERDTQRYNLESAILQ